MKYIYRKYISHKIAFGSTLRLCLLLVFFLSRGAFADIPDNDQVINTWQVEHVLINMNAERTVDYQIDDGRLVGKTIVFSNKKITSTIDGFGSCKQPSYHNASVKISTYVDSIMSKSDGSHFSDYTFNIPGDTVVNRYQITCHSGDISNSDTGESVEPAIYKDKLFMDWVDGTFLILERSGK